MHQMFDPERRCTPVAEWPERDRAVWARACQPFDPLELDVGFANRWAPATRRLIELSYGRWLGWLERNGNLAPDSAPGDRATRDEVRAYLAMLRSFEYAPYTIAGRLQQLGDALRAMAPDEDWSWILRAASRIKEHAHPVTDIRDRLQPPEAVLQLGLDLMEQADTKPLNEVGRAILHRDGLALAALIYRPLRIGNLASIKIGVHLNRQGSGWRLAFTEREMKAKRPFECPWPGELVDPLERYLGVHLNVLDGDGSARRHNPLWVSRTGAGMTRQVLGYRIRKRTKDAFGAAINPHSFRHIVATTVAMDDPENITAVPAILGHATLETSERHYNRAKMLVAGDRYQVSVAALRAKLIAAK